MRFLGGKSGRKVKFCGRKVKSSSLVVWIYPLPQVVYLSKTTHVTLSFSHTFLLLFSFPFSYFYYSSFPGSQCAVVVAEVAPVFLAPLRDQLIFDFHGSPLTLGTGVLVTHSSGASLKWISYVILEHHCLPTFSLKGIGGAIFIFPKQSKWFLKQCCL